MEKQHAKKFLKKYITVTGGPAAVDALDDENKGGKAKEFVKKYFTVVGGAEAIEAAAKQEHYLTMTLPEGSPETQISIIKGGDDPVGINIQYRVNYGDWTNWDFTNPQAISANANDVIQWKGNNPDGLSTDPDNDYVYFEIPNEVHLSGNVMSLIDGVGETKVIPCEYCFHYLFNDTKIKTVSEDFLPATTLADSCYYEMFADCTSLVNAPALPATTLAGWCYQSMFQGCTSLVNAPALPATTLTEGCYSDMFADCTSLVNAPALPATTLANECYNGMFNYCTSLVNAPALNATTLANRCYYYMFAWCSKLQNVTCLATNISAANTGHWLKDVSSTGTFVKAAGVSWPAGEDGIPSGWNVIEIKYLTMTLPEDSPETQISIKKYGEPVGTNIQYKVNDGNWTDWNFETSQPISAVAGDVIQWRGNNQDGLSTSDSNYISFEIPNDVYLSGNVMSLIDGIGNTDVIPCSYCFTGLFSNANIKTVTKDFLPARTLAGSCYELMFGGCTSLTTAPELPATTIADNCYRQMFAGCTSLTTAPELPATILTEGCYQGMFNGCSNLQHVTCLATDISATDCTSSWLSDVASTGTFNKAADVEWSTGVNGIPEGWTVIEPESKYLTMTLPEGSTTTQISIKKQGAPIGTNIQYRIKGGDWTNWDFTSSQAISANANDVIQWKGVNPNGLSISTNEYPGYSENYVYFDIPNEVHLSGNVMSLIDGVGDTKVIPCIGCFCNLFKNTKIKTVTEDFLPATTLAGGCYSYMFQGCTSLENTPALPATKIAEWCYTVMFGSCSSLITAPALPATTLAYRCYESMFNGCTSLVSAPELPATKIAPFCYQCMFEGCTSLKDAPALSARILKDFCYRSMFSGCTSLSTAPALPATTLARDCYLDMFNGCTSLTTAPALNATTLAENCCAGMFYGCTSLTTAPALNATTLVKSCYINMFNGCSNLKKVTCLATNISAQYCTNGWLSGVASTGTFVKAAGFNGWTTGISGIPVGWTVNDYVQPAKESV